MQTDIQTRYRALLMSWVATYDDYEPGDPIGFGWTERGAIEALKADLWDKFAESEERIQRGTAINNGIG